MRLIDADAIPWIVDGIGMIPVVGKDEIDEMPTIDAVPVKHGEWLDDKGLYRCSSCNHLWPELWWTENCPIERMLKIMPYCPNCGASMDGERKDDGDNH